MSLRKQHFETFFFCLLVFGAALAIQLYDQAEPCPLCIWQRLILILTGLSFFAAGAHYPKQLGQRLYAGWTALLSLTGIAISGFHYWIQHAPQTQGCGPSFDYMIERYGLTGAVKQMLHSPSSCSEISWTFLNLSLPGWSLLVFGGLFLISLFNLFRKFNTDNTSWN